MVSVDEAPRLRPVAAILAAAAMTAACGSIQVPTTRPPTVSAASAPVEATPTKPTPTAALSTATPILIPSASISAFAWRRASLPLDFAFGGQIQAALKGFVVTGSEGGPRWSEDGTKWSKLIGPPAWASFRRDGTSRGGFAFGCAHRPSGDVGCTPAAIWRSVDGSHWRRGSIRGIPPTSTIADIAVNEGRFLAIGATCAGTATSGDARIELVSTGCNPQALILTSTDGVHWRRTPGPPDAASAAFGQIQPAGRGFVLVGWRFVPASGVAEATTEAIVWTSPDGQTWGHSGFVLSGLGSFPIFATGAGRSYLLVGNTDSGSVQVWTSSDGERWSQTPEQPAFQGSAVEGVASTGSSVIAIGSGGDPGRIMAWTSTDGVSWNTANGPPRSSESDALVGVAFDGRRIVVLAASTTEENGTDHAMTWTTSISP
jgi:hypothetical protein